MLSNRKLKNSFIRTNDTFSSNTVDSRYVKLQNEVGQEIDLILDAFTTGSSDLDSLIAYDNYNDLADKLASLEQTGTDNQSRTFEQYRKLLIYSIEAAKRADTRQKEQLLLIEELQSKYDAVLNPICSKSVFETRVNVNTIASVKPEIVEYIKRGYNIIDADGYLIPIDMEVIAAIRIQLNMT